MALESVVTQEDISVHKRKLPKDLPGVSFLDKYRLGKRFVPKGYLSRNRTRFLDVHQRRCVRKRQRIGEVKDSTLQLGTPDNCSVQTMGLGQPRSSSALPNGLAYTKPLLKSTAEVLAVQTSQDHDTSNPKDLSMSSDTLLVKRKNDQYDSINRRFSRRQAGKVEDDPNAVLSIDLVNMRKKLNWKTNKRPKPEKPRKRARIDNISCHAHLTVWDNSPGKRGCDPIVIETESCEIIKDFDETDPVVGKFVNIKLDRPFHIQKRRLRVPIQTKGVTELAMAASYFMELKIVPSRTDSDWPPIPMLGKSEGDQMAKMEDLVKYRLQDSLVARHQTLTPDRETPLSIFYYSDGISYRTKYGLELDAKWVAPDMLTPSVKSEENGKLKLEIDPWMLDQNGNPFGRADPSRKKTRIPGRAKKSTIATISSADPKPMNPPSMPKPKIKYKFGGPKMNGAHKEFREMVSDDFTCPMCMGQQSKTLELLLLHLENDHHKYEYTLEHSNHDGTKVTEATIRVDEPGFVKPRSKDMHYRQLDTNLSWVAPAAPFDIQRHTIKGDRSWIGDDARPVSQRQNSSGIHLIAKVDKSTEIRKEHDGFLPSQHVQPFRPSVYKRKKYPNVRLKVMTDQSRPCTSISHRLILPEDADEDARSETDDEAEDSWFVSRYLEELDIYARESGWSDAKSRLMKKWGHHVLSRERSPHSRYISDSLIRFVSIERQWILRRGEQWKDALNRDELEAESIDALQQLMHEMLVKRVINQSVCDDIATMLDADENELKSPNKDREETKTQKFEVRYGRGVAWANNGFNLTGKSAYASHFDKAGVQFH